MITERRHQLILQQLKSNQVLTTKDLMKLTGASVSTIRRDLMQLEKQQLLLRVHGGCKSLNSHLHEEARVSQRQQMSLQQKRQIAKHAAALVQNNEVIFLDSGTTVQKMIPFLQNKQQLLVITNSVDNGSILADYQIKTIILGGNLRSLTKATVGPNIAVYLDNCHINRAFMGTNGFDSIHGYTTPDPDESAVKRLAIQHSDQAYILADSSKYGQVRFSKFADLAAAQLITDHLPTTAYHHLLDYTKVTEVKN